MERVVIHPGLFPWIVDYCIRNPVIVLLGVVMIIIFGIVAIPQIKLDALPDLSDNQVVVLADWMGRSPETVDAQVAYPLSTLLAALPHIKAIRSSSAFGICMIYVIFDDAVDIYWARTRVAERLARAGEVLPQGVVPMMGPEGTGVGHVYWYLVENDKDPSTPEYTLAELRSLQDWYIRYQLSTVQGVAEVASGGGFVKEYHVELDPVQLRRYMLMPEQIVDAIKRSNSDTGGRIIEQLDTEYFVRSLGHLGSREGGQPGATDTSAAVLQDLRDVVVAHSADGTAIHLGEVATVQLGSAQRRGALDHNGEGEAVTGIIVMRYGENAKSVIDAVKLKLEEVRRGLPPGVVITTAHDRSWLIERSIETLTKALKEEAVVVVLIILLFLLSLRPSIVVIITMPVAVLIGFIAMYLFGITSNIMSLGGVAIAIGVIVDDGIIMTENAHRHLANLWRRAKQLGRKPTPREITESIRIAAQQIAKPAFVTTLIIICGFVPVFFLTGQEGKLFSPLAYTKTFVMLASACMAVTLVPVLMTLIMRTRMLPEEHNPLSRLLNAIYQPPLRFAMQLRWLTIVLALAALAATWPIYRTLGHEFMPNLNEGELVYMPTTQPNVTVTEAKRILQLSDKLMRSCPLVVNVVGKLGRADTATDPAPVSMIETFVQLRQVRRAKRLPLWKPGDERAAVYLSAQNKLYSGEGGSWHEIDSKYARYTIHDVRADLDSMIRIPGVVNGWTMPIINRIQMLTTGVRTDLGIKIYGDDMDKLSALAVQASQVAQMVPGVTDVFPEKLTGGRYLDIQVDRAACARYGLDTGDVQSMIEMLVGGMPVTTTIEGRERYQVQVRYAADYRDTPSAIGDVLIDTPHQGPIPLKQVARIGFQSGPSMMSSENGLLRSVVFANVREPADGGDRARPDGSARQGADSAEGLLLPHRRPMGEHRARAQPAAVDPARRPADHLRLPVLHVQRHD